MEVRLFATRNLCSGVHSSSVSSVSSSPEKPADRFDTINFQINLTIDLYSIESSLDISLFDYSIVYRRPTCSVFAPDFRHFLY